MGIRGLTSFIRQHAHRFHQTYHLQDCYLVIDGCSLACQLYIHASNCNSAFGGDYDRYAQTVKEFFSLLTQCNVSPLVIIDGGYEARKLKTVSQRMKSKLHNAKVCNPCHQSTVFPLLMMEVFKQTLTDIGIKFAQADFEADFEIAAIARYLNCPVLSYDSDFYVFDVKYIPFETLHRSLAKEKCSGSVKYYLNCQIYIVEHFISSFGGLDKSLLPLMGTLLGNDYVPASIFKKFYNHVKLPKNKKATQQQRRIAAVFEWLRKETLETAIEKIINHLRKGDRKYVRKQIELSVSGYRNCQSDLVSFFGIETVKRAQEAPAAISQVCNSEDFNSAEDSSEESEIDNSLKECSDEDSIDEDSSDEDNTSELVCCDTIEDFTTNESEAACFPEWLRDKFRRGELPSYISDVVHLHIYFCQPQVEDFTLIDSHRLSFQILSVICGLLLSKFGEQPLDSKGSSIICYTRSSASRHEKFQLQSALSLPHFIEIQSISNSARKLLLLSTVGLKDCQEISVLDSFDERWQLFALTVVFWARNASSPPVTNCHLHALVVGMIALAVVDKKVGHIRHLKGIAKRKASLQKTDVKISQAKTEQEKFMTNITTITDSACSNVDFVSSLGGIFRQVTEIECLLVADSLIQFHQIDAKLKCSPRLFAPGIVHSFAQLQACLLQIMSLNSLLGFPFAQCKVAEIYSGTFACMAYMSFNKKSDIHRFVQTLLISSPTLFDLYNKLLNKFLNLLPNIPVLFRKGRKKKRKYSNRTCSDSSVAVTVQSDQESESGFDVENKFSVLSCL